MPCDVKNPLLGLNGAAYVFGPQKGAKFEDLPYFDTQMERMIKLYLEAKHGENYEDHFQKILRTPGTGASGGIVAAILALFDNSSIISGMDFVTNVCDLETQIQQSHVILTGEGSTD